MLSAVLAAVFLFLAALTNYTRTSFLFASRRMVSVKSGIFFRFPQMAPGEYHCLHPAWVLVGVPVLLFLFGLFFPGFRHALVSQWRQRKGALPILLTLIFLMVTFYPWNPLTGRQRELGVQVMLYLTLAFAGFVLLLFALYPVLGFADAIGQKVYQWLLNLRASHFLLLSAGCFFLITNLISFLVFEHLPHIQDSVAQLFQARIFASGRIHLRSPPFPEFFDYLHIINNGFWYSQYPWLHSFILMLFVLLGTPWLANPVLGTLTLPVIYLLGKEVYDEKTGRLSTILACLSPFIFNMSSEYMNHASALLFTSLFILFYFRTLNRHNSILNPLLAGAFIGLVANIRPYTGMAIALPFALYAIYLFCGSKGKYLKPFSLMLCSALALTSLVFVYNWLANGNPFLFGYLVNWGPGHEVGFGHSGWGPAHTPYRGLLNTGNKLNHINKFLLEWPLPGLLIVAIPFARGSRRCSDWLLLNGFLFLLLAYFFYFFSDACFGPRFLYESATCLIILTARGLIELPELLACAFGLTHYAQPESVKRFYARSFFLILIFLLGVALPPLWREYHSYGSVSARVARNVKKAGLNNALIFCARFGEGFSFNRLSLDGPVVYARDLGLFNPALTLIYPDRRCYYANYDTLIELKDLDYHHSLLKQTIDQLLLSLKDSALIANYRAILVPFSDLPLTIDTARFPVWIFDYRTVAREILMGRRRLNDYTPALALWVFNERWQAPAIFSGMNTRRQFITRGLMFTPLRFTENELGVVYDIRE